MPDENVSWALAFSFPVSGTRQRTAVGGAGDGKRKIILGAIIKIIWWIRRESSVQISLLTKQVN